MSWIYTEKQGYYGGMFMITIVAYENYTVGDVDGDGNVSFADINPFVYAVSHNETEFRMMYPHGHYWAADCNLDGTIDFDDINLFIELL